MPVTTSEVLSEYTINAIIARIVRLIDMAVAENLMLDRTALPRRLRSSYKSQRLVAVAASRGVSPAQHAKLPCTTIPAKSSCSSTCAATLCVTASGADSAEMVVSDAEVRVRWTFTIDVGSAMMSPAPTPGPRVLNLEVM